ncbi:MAG: hypothetical protein ACXAEL_04440 [Candidatus Hodarchaeales archaeon]|jgi:hypothetical protein
MLDPKIRTRLLEPPVTIPRLCDEDVFPSGETYLDRLFSTVHLWEQTRSEIHQHPENKKGILIRYEKEVKELLRQAESSDQY